MKIFTNMEGKVNFVDQNNVFVGYDFIADCCETFGFTLFQGDQVLYEQNNDCKEPLGPCPVDLEPYFFNTTYFREVRTSDGSTAFAEFELISLDSTQPILYLHIYNNHDDSYYHGFTFQQDDQIIKQGWL
jgi:hypothetical protein